MSCTIASVPTDAASPDASPTTGAEAALGARMAAARPGLDDPVIAAAMARLRSAHGVGMPARIGRYQLRRCLGMGGFAHVYAADDPLLSRTVAIKLPLAGTAALDDRFRHEAQVLAQLEHRNIVRIFDVGRREDASSAFIVMELVVGTTLATWLSRPRAVASTLAVFHDAASGIAAAHALGILHRDIKPSNILLGDDGVAKVADFGIARIRVDTTADDAADIASRPASARSDDSIDARWASGTPRYMAPEQRNGVATDERSDIYSFAVTLFEALYGATPSFDGDGQPIIPRRPRIPGRVRHALVRSLQPRVGDRLARMSEWTVALRPAAARPRVAVIGALALSLSALGIAWWGSHATPRATSPREPVVASPVAADDAPDIAAALAEVDARLDAYDVAGAAVVLERLATVAKQRHDDVTLLRVELRRAIAANTAGLERISEALLHEVVQASERLDDPHTKASAHLALALAAALGHRDRTEAELQLGFARAATARAGSPCDLVLAASARAGELLRLQGHAREALAVLGAVDSSASSCPSLHPRQRGRFSEALALAELASGDDAGATARLEGLLAAHERRWGPADPRLIGPLTNLALVSGSTRAFEACERYAGRVIALADLHHLDRGTIDAAISDLAMAMVVTGRREQGLPALEEVLQRRIARGAHPPRIAEARLRVGQQAIESGRFELGLRHAWGAVADFEATSGAAEQGAAIARISVAVASSGLGDERTAAEQYRLVLERFTPTLAPRHPLMLAARANLVKSELRSEHIDAAAQALADLEAALGDDARRPDRAAMLEHMHSMLAYRQGRRSEALALARRAVDHFGHEQSYDAASARDWLAASSAHEPRPSAIYEAIR